MRIAFLFLIGFLPAPCMTRADSFALAEGESASAKAGDFVFSGYGEAGRRSQAEDFAEEDTDEGYSYQNYHLKIEQKVSSRLNYDAGSFVYRKDYKDRDSLDNVSRIFKAGLSYDIKKLENERIGLDLKLKSRQKRYKNSPGSEYDEIGASPALTLEQKDNYRIDLTLGVDSFDYLSEGEKDQLKTSAGLGAQKHFLEERLALLSSYKVERLEQEKANREKTKHEAGGGFDYELDLPWIQRLASGLNWGQKDTKDEEDRDEDMDFEYWQYYAQSEHRINPKLKTRLKYQYFAKDYIAADLDHRGFYFRNVLDYELLDDPRQRLWLDFAVEHKEVKYNLKPANDYQKQTLYAKISYKKKKNWQASAGIEENFYNFSAGDNDKNRTNLKLSAEKLFQGGDLALSMDFKYRYTDHTRKEDKEEEALRLGFKYRF